MGDNGDCATSHRYLDRMVIFDAGHSDHGLRRRGIHICGKARIRCDMGSQISTSSLREENALARPLSRQVKIPIFLLQAMASEAR